MEIPPAPLRTLTAALARLVPPGACPGAVEAGAVEYIRRHFGGGPVARRLEEGLDRLDALARERHGAGLADLDPPRQDETLRAFEEGGAPGAGFLRMLVLLALEGSFCHPARGGNRGGAGWRFAGLGQEADDPAHPLGFSPDPSRCRGW
jgi:hypothetical protein